MTHSHCKHEIKTNFIIHCKHEVKTNFIIHCKHEVKTNVMINLIEALHRIIIPPLPEGGGGYTVLPLSVLPSV